MAPTMIVEHINTFVSALQYRNYCKSYQKIQQTVSVKSVAAAPQVLGKAWEVAQ